jgi:hypothetical protein
MNRNEIYIVHDLGQATYLRTQGFIVQDIQPDPDRPGLLVFYFEKSDEIADEAARYNKKEGLVEPRSFLWTLKSLKTGGAR